MEKDLFYVWCADGGESEHDAGEIRASSFKHAAEEWAMRDDAYSAEYSIIGGKDVTVHVKHNGQRKVMIVSGEAEPTYYAREVTE